MENVIAAVCTPMMKSALAVIRMSGNGTERISREIFGELEPRKAYHRTVDTKKIKDGVVAVFYKAPFSFTGEDTLEITCHGNPVIVNSILDFLYALGARPAKNGEFTKRAYINGKTDLTAAEGIKDIIDAETEMGVRLAFDASRGKLFSKIRELQEQLRELNAKTEVAIDYPEEDIEEIANGEIKSELGELIVNAKRLLMSYEGGRIIKEGIRVAIVGRPNTGKSSLLNRLIGDEAAIVTDIAGTTRDVVRGRYYYRGICFLVADTAGIRETADPVEKIGVQRSIDEANDSDVVLFLYEKDEKSDFGGKAIRVKNKSDIDRDDEADVNVSAKTGENIEALKEIIYSACVRGVDEEFMLTNRRQYDCMKECLDSLSNAYQNLSRVTLDCISADLSDAYNALGKITGLIGSDEIIDSIFQNFCVGK